LHVSGVILPIFSITMGYLTDDINQKPWDANGLY